MAMTVDGKIARNQEELTNWTSPEDKKLFAKTTKEAGVFIIGHRTYKTIGKPLPGRLNVVLTRSPDKHKSQKGVLEFTDSPLRELVKDLHARGFSTIVVAGGASVNGQFLREGLITDLLVSIEPKIFGQGIDLFEGVSLEKDLTLVSVEQLHPHNILLHYKVINN